MSNLESKEERGKWRGCIKQAVGLMDHFNVDTGPYVGFGFIESHLEANTGLSAFLGLG